ncbi:NAD-dependent epimerase/dehydratase family protein [Actinokineospora auranticolor]|uniref:Nucleoside-diphosphate-sugar epimerase n=1 Tax=Actinokineospora auranticolor TaxID=155976 RepID=A0A2S6GTK9_9PSEU|nr:NAD-dependent epimerase/dehydratase family protein [Actinokineospora auranticolor]PPK68544.1 nucleoside-diphosphate-sugar epimerase [Actinokineospora auranticolor]
MNALELHVVFGTGPAGLTLVDELLARGHRVRAVNRSGSASVPRAAELVAADITDEPRMREVCAGATAIYHCAHAPYHLWDDLLPRLQAGFLAGAASSGARLVVTDTLYMYGPTGGEPMTERTPHRATSHKGRLRAEVADRYLRAHTDGVAEVAIARAADFYGPRVLNSALGGAVFVPALHGEPVVALGDIDQPHAFSHIGDVARALATLGERPEALGRVWHVPTISTLSTRQVHGLIERELGVELTRDVLPAATDRAWGPFDEVFMREYAELFYQYLEPQIVDCRAVEDAFGLRPTPFEEGIAATIAWYRQLLG